MGWILFGIVGWGFAVAFTLAVVSMTSDPVRNSLEEDPRSCSLEDVSKFG